MILTRTIKHQEDFKEHLKKAKLVAETVVMFKKATFSSADFKSLGLKSAIINQVIRKYKKCKTAKKVSNVNLIIPGQGIKTEKNNFIIYIPCLNLRIKNIVSNAIKINQIEISAFKIFVSATFKELPEYNYKSCIGVDLNCSGNDIQIASSNGKTTCLDGSLQHLQNKYKKIIARSQRNNKFRLAKRLHTRFFNIRRDKIHKATRKLISLAIKNTQGIALEDLTNIRRAVNKQKYKSKQKSSVNNWPFYYFRKLVEYKAKLLGVPVILVDPAYSSQTCSKCGVLGIRQLKVFNCKCGHNQHADINAAINIAKLMKHAVFPIQDIGKGSAETPSLIQAIA